MNSSLVAAIPPFWILGFPLVVAIISLLRLPKSRDLAAPHHRGPRGNGASAQSI